MSIKILKLTFIILIVQNGIFAQQRAAYTQYLTNPYLLNPALTGIYDFAHLAAGYRMQGQNGIHSNSPTSFYVSGHSNVGRGSRKPHPFLNKRMAYHSFGGNVFKDQTSPVGSQGVFGTYAYNQRIKGNWRIAIGGSIGINRFTKDGNRLYFPNPEIEIPVNENWRPDGNVGFYIYSKHFYVGGSIQQLLAKKLDFDLPISTDGTKYARNLSQHYFMNGGVKLDLTRDWRLEPSTLLKFENQKQFNADVNCKISFKDEIWLISSYRNFDSFAFVVGFDLWEQLEFNYMYDYSYLKTPFYTSGCHEIVIGYRLWPRPRCNLSPIDYW